jgi:hypothetical protein
MAYVTGCSLSVSLRWGHGAVNESEAGMISQPCCGPENRKSSQTADRMILAALQFRKFLPLRRSRDLACFRKQLRTLAIAVAADKCFEVPRIFGRIRRNGDGFLERQGAEGGYKEAAGSNQRWGLYRERMEGAFRSRVHQTPGTRNLGSANQGLAACSRFRRKQEGIGVFLCAYCISQQLLSLK